MLLLVSVGFRSWLSSVECMCCSVCGFRFWLWFLSILYICVCVSPCFSSFICCFGVILSGSSQSCMVLCGMLYCLANARCDSLLSFRYCCIIFALSLLSSFGLMRSVM